MEIHHFSHQHPLVVVDDYKGEPVDCFGCEQSISGTSYGCSFCKFFLHKSCAQQPMTFAHFSHNHRLVLDYCYDPRRCYCYGCRRSISGDYYACYRCYFFLHASCAMLPTEMDHPLHTQHKLFLLLFPPQYHDGSSCVCNACLKSPKGFTYHCVRCRFDLHTECATLPSTIASRRHHHPHPLTLFLKSACFSCDDCHTNVQGISYLCYTCQFWVDPNCASLGSLSESQALSKDTIPMDDEGQGSDTILNKIYHVFFGSLAHRVEKISLREKERLTSLTHFSHLKHSLIHGDELKRDRMCGMCMQKISSPFFGCAECNFFLHELCAELPLHKKHPLEPHHPLTLHPADDFSCSNCNKSSYGFFYGCDDQDYNFKLDLRCGSIEDTLEHKGHEHPLYLVEERSSKECNACCNLCVGNTYVCVICDFYLEARCAVLPLTARHRYDKHLLTLVCHSDNDELGQFTCEPCDSERDPKPWFYECVPCRFTAHVECINGKY